MFLARFLYHNLKKDRWLIILAVLMTFAEVGADLASIQPLRYIIDASAANNPVPQFPFSEQLLAFFSQFDSAAKGVIALSVALLIVLGGIAALLSFLQQYIAVKIAKTLTLDLSQELFNKLQHLSVSWHNARERKPGDLSQRVTSNMTDLEKFVTDGMVDLMTALLTIVGVIVVMLLTSFPLTILSLAIIPILGVIVYFYTTTIDKLTKKEKKAEGRIANTALDAMTKIMEVKAFTLEQTMFRQFQERASKKFEAGQKAGVLQAQFTPLVDLVLVFGTAVILFVGATAYFYTTQKSTIPLGPFPLGPLTITRQQATLGILVAFLTYLGKLYQPLRDLSKLTLLKANASAAAERIQEVLDVASVEGGNESDAYAQSKRLQGNIKFEDVFFSYEGSKKLVLKGIDLEIPAGKKIALVGLSGSGKTTLTNLLPRFYDVIDGKVKIDGKNVQEYSLSVLRRNISIVFQESILFDKTIGENIKIGNPNASEADVIRAATQAYIHEAIENKLGGYHQEITGKDLSGGQRQRIAIARAILRDAPIIIMDEPTASLDAEAEAEVMSALDSLAEKRTVLMITHRLSTVGKVDEIVVMKDGRIVERDTLSNLLQLNGVFAALWRAQQPPMIDKMSESLIRTSSAPPDPATSQGEIIIETSGRPAEKYSLKKASITIGSSSKMDIYIPQQNAPYVSRLHAIISWEQNAWVIRDNGSTNKTYHNGQPLDSRPLSDGDSLYLGAATLVPNGSACLVYRGVSPKPMSGSSLVDSGFKTIRAFNAKIVIGVDEKTISEHPLAVHDPRLLQAGRLTLGRDSRAPNKPDILIPDQLTTKDVSRSHCYIVWENNDWVIKPETLLDPTQNLKKIVYNGQVIMVSHVLNHGDYIFLSPRVWLRYEKQ